MKKVFNFLKNNWIIIYIAIQPILDIISYFQSKYLDTSYTWIIRIIMLFCLCVILFIKSKDKKKNILFLCPIAIYFFMHFINLYRINSLYFIMDLKYFLFTFQPLILSILFIYYFKQNKNQIKKSKIGIVISAIILITSIIISYFTNSYEVTYSLRLVEYINIGIIGWFSSANTNSMILCAVIPWFTYYFLKKKNPFIYGIASCISFLILYTNATKSCYITLVTMLIVLIYICIFDNISYKKIKITMSLVLLFLALFLFKCSSTALRLKELDINVDSYKNETVDKPTAPDEPTIDNSLIEKDKLDLEKENFKKKISTSYIYKRLLDIYGVDKLFIALDGNITDEQLADNRLLKRTNSKIIYNDSDLLTKVLGIGYGRVQMQGYDMENDLHAIFYYYGYLGFLVYVLYIFYFLFIMLKAIKTNYKSIFDGEFIILGYMLLLLLVGGEYSGAFLRKINANIYLAFYLAFIYFKCYDLTQNNKKNQKYKHVN